MVARVGLEPVTLWTKGAESTNEPPRPLRVCVSASFVVQIADWLFLAGIFREKFVTQITLNIIIFVYLHLLTSHRENTVYILSITLITLIALLIESLLWSGAALRPIPVILA